MSTQTTTSKNLKKEENRDLIVLELYKSLKNTGLGSIKKGIIEHIAESVLDHFGGKKVKVETVLEAINDGGLGKYGKTFNFTAQEVGGWIYKKTRENQAKNKDKI